MEAGFSRSFVPVQGEPLYRRQYTSLPQPGLALRAGRHQGAQDLCRTCGNHPKLWEGSLAWDLNWTGQSVAVAWGF